MLERLPDDDEYEYFLDLSAEECQSFKEKKWVEEEEEATEIGGQLIGEGSLKLTRSD